MLCIVSIAAVILTDTLLSPDPAVQTREVTMQSFPDSIQYSINRQFQRFGL